MMITAIPTNAMFSSDDTLDLTIAAHSQNHSLGHSLFAQLRSRFPQGALISELVQVYEGQFVVRAIVQVGTTTMATGMAAAEKIEVAEDRARVRAMEVLGISPTGGSTTFDVSARSLTEASLTEPPKQTEPSFEPTLEPVTQFDAPLPSVEELVPDAILEPAPKKPTRKKKEEVPEVAPVRDLLSFPGLDMPEIKAPEIEVEDVPDFDEPEPPAPEPIDLSDAIAQIGTEIERIGWTKKQGSTYLQDTYGKKTRAELTEDELIEFLHYLKALPSKGHPSLNQIPF